MSGQLLLFAEIPLTPHQLAMAARTAKANRQRIEREKYLAAAATEFKAMKRRRDLLHLRRVEGSKQDAAEACALRNLKMAKTEARARAFAFFITMVVPQSSQFIPPDIMPVVYSSLVNNLRYNPALKSL